MSPRAKTLQRLMLRTVRELDNEYQLFAPGDRIAVAVSGGKDSYGMLKLLTQLQRDLPYSIELVALHLDQQQPGYDGAPLVTWLKASGVPFEILREDTYSVVVSQTKPGQTFCTVCSRLRRGALYTAMERMGCNKLALGHHRDDALETFLMNLFFSGKLQAMPPKYRTDDGKFEVIRPLLQCAEPWLEEFARLMEFPILPCNLCGAQAGLERDEMQRLLTQLEQKHPHLRSVMFNALGNIRPTHLLDRDVLAAWQHRPEHIRPDRIAKTTARRMGAESVLRHLPILSDATQE
jgi:tRNA 2-thiocytidine biosynthesis protein TtcA